jgi:hypothetical protein
MVALALIVLIIVAAVVIIAAGFLGWQLSDGRLPRRRGSDSDAGPPGS